MPTLKTPLYGSYNQRSFVNVTNLARSQDQFSRGTVLTKVVNPITQSVTAYLEKRSGLIQAVATVSSAFDYQVYPSPSTERIYHIGINGGIYHLFDNTTDCGIITGVTTNLKQYFTETIISGVTYILIASNLGGWFLPSDSTTGLSFTGTTHSNTTMDGIASTTGIYPGQAISGSGLNAATRVATVVGPNSITLTIAASSSVTATFTREAIAKIIDADFPADIIGGFAEIDGYACIMTSSGKVYNSDLGSVTSWSASNFLTCSQYGDNGVGVIRYKNYIAAFSNDSIEMLSNAGNASGSPFSAAPQLSTNAKNVSPSVAYALTSMDGVLYWLGADGNIYRMDGFVPQKINTFGAPTGARSSGGFFGLVASSWCEAFVYNKQTFLNIYDQNAIDCIWYSIDNGTFHHPNFNSGGFGGGTYGGAESSHVGSVAGVSYFTTNQGTGKVFTLPDNHYGFLSMAFTDNANAYSMSVQFAQVGSGRVTPSEIRIIADNQASGSLSVSWSDDDGVTFTTARTIALTNGVKKLRGRLGSFKGKRLWRFEHNAATPFRAQQADIDYTESAA